MTLNEIAQKVTDLRTQYRSKWHVSLSETSHGIYIAFFVDIADDTRETRATIKKLFGEPSETRFWEEEDYYVTYRYYYGQSEDY